MASAANSVLAKLHRPGGWFFGRPGRPVSLFSLPSPKRGWSAEEASIISYATKGTAVVSKAAGNDSVAVGGIAGSQQDYLDLALVGKASAIFVGALDGNGSPIWKRSPAGITPSSRRRVNTP